MPPNSADHLRETALELGFDDAAWVDVQPSKLEITAYKTWLEAGRHAGMDYLERDVQRRADVTTTFAPARSALVLMVSHNHPDPGVPSVGTRVGRVARYAWSRDYHEAIKPALQQLEVTAAKLGVQAKAVVDHAPVLERGLAARAGLGWRGRSSQVISTKLGALTTLAVLLTDLAEGKEQREEGEEHPDRCGKCMACVRDCPTAAILPGRVVDSRLCIAYYTVEHRGPIPLELRSRFGDHLFGCDDCLEVCPWTTHAGRFSKLLEPDPELAHPDLEPFFTRSGKQFDKRYAHTAFSRARRKGMARNAALVLGNLRDEAHLDLLELGARDDAWEVREACAWALGRFGSSRAERAIDHMRSDAHDVVRETVTRALTGEFSSQK
jgi:epoxyqueuosine reductase